MIVLYREEKDLNLYDVCMVNDLQHLKMCHIISSLCYIFVKIVARSHFYGITVESRNSKLSFVTKIFYYCEIFAIEHVIYGIM